MWKQPKIGDSVKVRRVGDIKPTKYEKFIGKVGVVLKDSIRYNASFEVLFEKNLISDLHEEVLLVVNANWIVKLINVIKNLWYKV